MATNIDPRSVFPSYELLAPSDPDAQGDAADNVVAAVQATATPTLVDGTLSLAVANAGTFYANAPKITIDAPGAGNVAQVNSSGTITINNIPVNGKTVTIGGTAISFGDMSATSDIKTDISGSSAVTALPSTGTVTVTAVPNSTLAGVAMTIDGTTLTEGTEWARGGTNAEAATNLAAAINALNDFTAVASTTDISITHNTMGVAGDVALTSTAPALVIVPANLAGGRDAVNAGDAKDDLSASLAQYINTNLAGFSASSASNVVTIESTLSNGTDPAGAIAGDAITLSTDAAAIAVSGTTLENGTIETRAATAEVVLNSDADAALRGTVASINVTDAGSGYAAAPAVVIEAPAANVIDQIAKAGAQATVGSNTFSYAKEYIAIALEDIIVGSGINSQSLSSAEAAKTSGDMRKVAYHIVRQYFDYLSKQNSIESITISTGGTGYQVGDTIVVSGGTEQVAFTVSEIDNGTASGVGSVTEIQSGGLVYSGTHSNPPVGRGFTTATYNVNSAYQGTGCVLVINLTDNQPSAFSMSRSAISENVATGILTRTYSASFDFDETGLEVVDES